MKSNKSFVMILAVIGVVAAVVIPFGTKASSKKDILKSDITRYVRTAPDAKLVYPIDLKDSENEWPEALLDSIVSTPEMTVINADERTPYTLTFNYSDASDYWITTTGDKATNVKVGELPDGEHMRCLLNSIAEDGTVTSADAVYFYSIVDPSTGLASEQFIEGENRLVVAMLSPNAVTGKYTQKILWTTVTGVN